MTPSFYKQFRWIEKEIKKTSDELVNNIAEKAKMDLIEAHEQIIGNYYKAYPKPHYYHRQGKNGLGGLYSSLVKYNVKGGSAKIFVGSDGMSPHNDYKGEDKRDLVFDLMWDEGIRGLPKQGSMDLTKSFEWHGFSKTRSNTPVNWGTEGHVWENPYWNQAKYKNEFSTKIKIGAFTSTIDGTPENVMLDFVKHWGDDRGVEICKEVEKEIGKKNEGHISYAPF